MLENKDLAAMRALMKGAGGTGGGTSIDVTAQVGQTIVVKEVDANGKPTAWESADYQPRTHWSEVTTILPETTVDIDLELGGAELPYDFTLEAGKEYTVIYNGVEYTGVECIDCSEGSLALGNVGAIEESLPVTGHPFIIVYEPFTEDENGNPIFAGAVMPLDGSTSVTLSIFEEAVTQIPEKYLSNAMPYYIDVTTAEDGTMSIKENVYEINAIYNSGRDMILRSVTTETNPNVVWVCRLTQVFGCTYSFSSVADKSIIYRLVLSPQEDGTFQVTY